MTPEQAHGHKTSIAGRLLVRLVEAVCRLPWLILAVTLVLCGLSLYSAWTRLEYRTQRSDLVSPRKEHHHRWQRYVDEFGDDNDLVVVVKGTDPARMQCALEALAREIEKYPQLFDRLFYKVDLRSLQSRALLYLPVASIRQIQDNLKSMSLLLELGPLSWRSLGLLNLLREARTRAGRILPDQALSADDDQFLTQLLAVTQAATASLENPATYRNPWHSVVSQPPEQTDLLAQPQYFYSDDASLAFLLVRPANEPSSFTGNAKSVNTLRAILATVRPAYADLEFGLTGLPVLENDEMVASQNDTTTASWLALAGVAVLYLIVFRSFRYPLLTITTLLVGTAWAVGWLTVTVGHLNILSATFAVMLIGMGDYGVLWVSRYEQERAAGLDVISAMRKTASNVGPSVLTAAMTTALAFYAAMLADFQAVAELGWIAGSGVLLCALSCFTVMPALLRLVDRREQLGPVSLPIPTPSPWLPALAAKPAWVIGVGVSLTTLLAVWACRVHYDHNLLHLQARGLESVEWELKLIEHTAGASWHALSYTASPEQALALKQRYEQLPDVSRVAEVASLVPRDQEQKLVQLQDIQHRLRHLPARGTDIPRDRPNAQALKTELDCLNLQLQPLADVNPQPLLADLRKTLVALRLKLDTVASRANVNDLLRRFEQQLTRDLAEDLHRLRDVTTPIPIAMADLPPELRTRYVGKTGKWLLRVFAKECLWDYGPLAHFVNATRTVDPEATGKPFTTLEGLRAMKSGFQWAGLYALVAIVLVLLADFRDPRHTLLALTPLAIGVVMSLGVMGLFGLPLNPANMIAFPLILGVGVDNGVHVLHDYRMRNKGGPYTLSLATGRGIFVAALTTILGFGTLMISQHRGLSGLGLMLTLGVSCCMLASLVFLPALLRVLSSKNDDRAEPNWEVGQHRAAA
jgi:hypothetical protein